MKSKLRLFLIVALIFSFVLSFASCGCDHVDKNDDGKCDECSKDFSDGCDVHVDKNDDSE